MYPLNTLTEALYTRLWERAEQIKAEQTSSWFGERRPRLWPDVHSIYQQLQRDVVTLVMKSLGEVGESPTVDDDFVIERGSPMSEKPQMDDTELGFNWCMDTVTLQHETTIVIENAAGDEVHLTTADLHKMLRELENT